MARGRRESLSVLNEFVHGDFDACGDFPRVNARTSHPAMKKRCDLLHDLLWKMAGGTKECCARLLHDYLRRHEDINGEVEKLSDAEEKENYDKLLGYIESAFNASTHDADKRQFLQLVCDVSLSKLKASGFNVGYKLLASVRDEVLSTGMGPKKARKRGTEGAPISPEKRKKLRDLFLDSSRVSSNQVSSARRSLEDEGKGDAVRRVLTAPPTSVGDRAEAEKICTRKTAVKYMQIENVHRATSLTDKCHYCDRLRELILYERHFVRSLIRRNKLDDFYGSEDNHPATLEGLMTSAVWKPEQQFSAVDFDAVCKFELEKACLVFHRQVNEAQRAAFQSHIDGCIAPARYVVILFDFTTEEVNRGPINLDQQYYGTRTVTMFIAVCWLPGMVQPVVICLVSPCLNKSAEVANYCIGRVCALLRRRAATRTIWQKITEIKFWCDAGSHFVAYEFAWYALVRLGRYEGSDTELNFHERKHGKSRCDEMAQKLGLSLETYAKSEYIMGEHDIVTGLRAEHARVQKSRKMRQEAEFELIAETYGIADIIKATKESGQYELKVTGLKSTLCLRRAKGFNSPIRNATLSGNDAAVVIAGLTPTKIARDDLRPADGSHLRISAAVPEKRRIRVGTLLARERAMKHSMGLTPPLHQNDPAHSAIRAHAVKFEPRITQAAARLMGVEACRMFHYDLSSDQGYWVVGKLLGELTEEELRENFGTSKARRVYAELYTSSAVLSAVFAVEDIVAWACGKKPSFHFLNPTVGSHIGSRSGEERDFWVECTACRVWRVVLASTFAAAQAAGTRGSWTCEGGCGAPLGAVERSLL